MRVTSFLPYLMLLALVLGASSWSLACDAPQPAGDCAAAGCPEATLQPGGHDHRDGVLADSPVLSAPHLGEASGPAATPNLLAQGAWPREPFPLPRLPAPSSRFAVFVVQRV
jgi:hypothetical protein